MELTTTEFRDLFIIKPPVFEDNRGCFFESYNKSVLSDNGIQYDFVQDNQSESSYGVIRGLHYQLNPFAQTKLVRAVTGKILDVAVDLRKNSPTYGKYFSIVLTSENKKQLLIPQGFAHGFSVLSGNAVVSYKTNNFYNKNAERGIVYNDEKLGIDWKIPPADAIVSERDKDMPFFVTAEANFTY